MVLDYIMCERPINCRYCQHAYYGLLHMVNEAKARNFNIADLSGSDCVKDKIYQAITDYDPQFFFGLGHGNICVYTDDNEEAAFTCPNSSPGKTEMFANRIVYLWSCLTGYDCKGHPEPECENICAGPVHPMSCCYWNGDSCNSLGDSIIEAGGLAYAGFNISWTWLSVTSPIGDPYADKYAHGFWESGNELILAMLQFKTLSEAGSQSVDKYNWWINYWKTTGASDPLALECIKWLVHDRDGLVLLGDLNAVLIPAIDCTQLAEAECLAHPGCHWWNNSCHDTLPTLPVDDSKDFTIKIKGVFIWNTSTTTNMVYKLDQQGNIIKSFSLPGRYPQGLGIDADGYIWSVIWGMIVKLDQQGNIIKTLASPGDGPRGIGIDAEGYIWIADAADKRIYKIDQQGNIIKSFMSKGDAPTGIGIDADGYIWNADLTDDMIYQTTQGGSIVKSFPSPGPMPTGIGIDGDGYIWNADWNEQKIYKLDQQGNIIKSFSSPGAGPVGIAIE